MPVSTFTPARTFGPAVPPARPKRKRRNKRRKRPPKSCKKRAKPKPKPKHPNRGWKPDKAAAVVRGAMARTLDRGFTAGPLGGVLWQGDELPPEAVRFVQRFSDLAARRDHPGMLAALRGYGLDVFQALACVLFPELYGGVGRGLAPDGGPERVGKDRWEAFAKSVVRGEAGR